MYIVIVRVGQVLQRLYNWQFVNQHRPLLLRPYSKLTAGGAGAGLILEQ